VWYMPDPDLIEPTPPSLRDQEADICGSLDAATGVTCALPVHRDDNHCNDDDWGLIFKWRTPIDLSLLVVGEVDEA
jgi:hypothetical protein